MVIKLYTLVFVRKDDEILLGLKNRDFGKGKWNGFGGKVEPDEEIDNAARRELLEESNLTAKNLIKKGILQFESVGNPVIKEVHVYLTTNFTGEPQESEEMKPIKWFSIEELPFEEMWADYTEWFPIFLKGILFKAYFKFEGENNIIEANVKQVSTL